MSNQLYLHTTPVVLAGTGKRGMVMRDRNGRLYLIGPHVACLSTKPKSGPSPCPCGWGGLTFKCGGSCEMRFGKGGCE